MRRFCSIFNQLLQLFPRLEFQAAVIESKAERHARGFTCWGQFVAMLFCQLGKAHSLREICGGLASCEGKLAHLGITAPTRSTLSYANAHRPWQLYQGIFYQLLARCREVAPRKRFRFKNPLLTLDATMIDLCAEIFPWATYKRTKGAVKLHFTLDHDGYLPTVLVITAGHVRETLVAAHQHFVPGTILIFDRGYLHLRWFADLTQHGVFFVTRVHEKANYRVIADRPVPQHRHIVHDQCIQFCKSARSKYSGTLRRIVVQTPDRSLALLTNHLTLGASTIAQIYRDRWQIELFFKALKQHLRVKSFVGTSANALHIQIWTALIALLLLKYLQLKARFGWSLSNLAALLRMNLFAYRDLWEWVHEPFTGPPVLSVPLQQKFVFA
jgi:Transposase DDE domain/Domain of unknown function (DUF4372)